MPLLRRMVFEAGRYRDLRERASEVVDAALRNPEIARYIDPTIPELGIAALPHYRGRGIGDALIDALLKQAQTSGLTAVSLSTRGDNPATRLCRRHGFVTVRTVPAENGGTAWTMRSDLR